MSILTKRKHSIGTQASIANRDDWYTDAVFARQSFTGPNPTTITRASAERIQRFMNVARLRENDAMLSSLHLAKPGAICIRDCSYFREAAGSLPDSTLKSDNGKRYGCAAVTLFHLTESGVLHPLAIVIDYVLNLENSVVIFNRRLSPADANEGEKDDWPWRYAKMCSQISDWTRHELQVYLNDCHIVEEATIVAAQWSFTAQHIVFRILEPYCKSFYLPSTAKPSI